MSTLTTQHLDDAEENTIDDDLVSFVNVPNTDITLKILEDLAPSCCDSNNNTEKGDNDGEDNNDDEDDDVEDAVGRFVWPTALPLLRHIVKEWDVVGDDDDDENANEKEGKTTKNESNNIIRHIPKLIVVVELGAGCGVLGMGLTASLAAASAAATASAASASSSAAGTTSRTRRRGSRGHVILTDHDDEWLQRNVNLNEKAIIREQQQQQQGEEGWSMEVMKLDWRNEIDIAMVQQRIQNYYNDDNNKNDNNNNDDEFLLWIVGSDILYNHDSHESLANTVYQLTKEIQIPIQTQQQSQQKSKQQQQQPRKTTTTTTTTTTRITIGFPERNDQNLDEDNFLKCLNKYFRSVDGEGDDNKIIIGPSQPLMSLGRKKKSNNNNLRVIDFMV